MPKRYRHYSAVLCVSSVVSQGTERLFKVIVCLCLVKKKVTHGGSGGLGPDPHALLFSIICWSAAPDPTLCVDLFDSASRCTTPIGT